MKIRYLPILCIAACITILLTSCALPTEKTENSVKTQAASQNSSQTISPQENSNANISDTVVSKQSYTSKKYTVAKSFSITKKESYQAGSKLKVTVTARAKATVTAKLDGKKITLKPEAQSGNNFTTFSGSFTLPSGHFKNLNLGKINIKATYKNYTDTFNSKDIICKKEKIVKSSNPKVTPKDKDYIDVGSGIITEIVSSTAETFSGNDKKDTSKPYNNYLPKGTVDYGSAKYTTVKRDGKSFKLLTLRCGKKIYKAWYDTPTDKKITVAKQYVGTLPDHNEIGLSAFKTGATHTVLRLDTMWKAPFELELKKQEYNSDYTVDKVTYTYVDITFCYATSFEGKVTVPKDNPLFSKAKIIKNEYDYTLRLYLKRKGGFYGWDAYYDSQGRLCFKFLNPVKISKAKNEYGADLTGTRILIDVGHGGKDGGAVGKDNKDEASYNLSLAKKLKKELESIGATVYLTRSDDSLSTAYDKLKILRNLKPDYCIAIHHDFNNYSSLNGIGAYYYYPFSKKAAKYVLDRSFDTKIYKNKKFTRHFYYMNRCSVCPVVLTENGYMSNSYDYEKIKSSTVATQKAKALTHGIVDYFLSIQ